MVQGLSSIEASGAMTNWEYKFVVETINAEQPRDVTAMLNEHGGAGWELVNFSHTYQPASVGRQEETDTLRLIFKRPVV